MIPTPTMCPPAPTDPSDAPNSSGGRLVSVDGRSLPLRAANLRADASAGLARVQLEQTFVNPHPEPLRVTYQVPLPADGAVSGLRFTIDGVETVGRVETLEAAREQFEQALIEGRSAALLEQDRSSLFTQEVGNIPPGATVVVRIDVDQLLSWRAEGERSGWEWRFPTVVAPRYLGSPGRVADGARVHTEVADGPTGVVVTMQLTIRDSAGAGLPSSPSHTLVIERSGDRRRCELATGATLDRDLVVSWPAALAEPGVAVDVARPSAEQTTASHAYALLTITPPTFETTSVPRDLIVLLDTSGSMHGEPLAQAKAVVAGLVDSLTDRDQLELIEFSSAARRFARQPVPGSAAMRAKAHAWLQSLQASGGTEMRSGILAALEGIRPEAQRQIVLITDGLIGFESEIVDEVAHRLPAGSRLHTIGVGSAINRSLTRPAARAGRGIEIVIGLGEDPERTTQRLLARTRAPQVVDVSIEGEAVVEAASRYLPDLFAGAPVRIAAMLRPEGGRLQVRGRTADGTWTQTLELPAVEAGTGSSALAPTFARERVEDLEIEATSGHAGADVDAEITRLGLAFQISTRLTSWVAVATEPTVDPRSPTRRETMPQALPHGMSVAGLGLRAASGVMAEALTMAAPMMAGGFGPPAAAPAPAGPPKSAARARGFAKKVADAFGGMIGKGRGASVSREAPPPPSAPRPADEEKASRAHEAWEGGAGGGPGFAEYDDEYDEPAQAAAFSRPGRLVERGGRWFIEFDVDVTLDWFLPESLTLTFDDGGTVTVAIVEDRSTRSGRVLTGASLRLALAHDPAPATTATTATFETPDGSSWRIDLSRVG